MASAGEFDLSFLDAGAEERRQIAKQRSRRGIALSAAVTVIWLLAVTVTASWGRVVDNWATALTMVFGSFVGGATPQGGGAVGFPVLTKVLEVPAEVARTFSLCIQVVGMGTASLAIIVNRRRVEWRVIRMAFPVALVAFMATIYLAGDSDKLFWPSKLPGAYVKVTFTLVLAAMAFVVYLGTRTPVRQVGRRLPDLNIRLRVAMVIAGLVGGVASALVGSGIDVFIYLFIVVLFGLDPRIGVPTSVILMSMISVVGLIMFGLVDGQLDIVLNADGAVAAVGGTPVEPALSARRFDLYGMWLAAAPIVAWGGPLGSLLASKLTSRQLVVFVLSLSVAETLSTIIFLDALHTDVGLIVYGVVGLVIAAASLWWLANNRLRVFDLPRLDPGATLSRADVEVTPHYADDLPEGQS